MADPEPKTSREANPEKRMELTEHLAELRTRIMRSIVYVLVCACVCYYFLRPIYDFFYVPLQRSLRANRIEPVIMFPHFAEPFMLALQICVVAGALLSAPLVTMEMWGFVRPALTPQERRPLRWVAPMSVLLFAAGAVLSYAIATMAFNWFLGYLAVFPDAKLLQNPRTYVIFMLKMMGAFGLVFQLPVVLMFLAWVGLLTSSAMKKSWRHAVVGISVIGMIITPSNDAFTMLMMTIPVVGLYVLSIGLVALIERKRRRDRSAAP